MRCQRPGAHRRRPATIATRAADEPTMAGRGPSPARRASATRCSLGGWILAPVMACSRSVAWSPAGRRAGGARPPRCARPVPNTNMTHFSQRSRRDLQLNAFSSALAELRARGEALIDLTESNPIEAGLGLPEEQLLPLLWQPG